MIKLPTLQKGVDSFLKKLKRQKSDAPPAQKVREEKSDTVFLNAKKQAEIDLLCNQLFKRKDLITSGKLQILGLSDVKKRLGKSWPGLSKIIYTTVETISTKYLDKGDIFIPYRDNSYIFIFSTSSLEEGQLKARLISLKIQEELFSLEEEELRRIEISHSVRVLNTKMMKGGSLSEAIEHMNTEVELVSPSMSIEESLATRLPPLVTEISAKNYRSDNKFSKQITPLPSLNLMYMPIWDAEQESLASYLCLPSGKDQDGNLLQEYRENCANQNLHSKAAYDLSILAGVALELDQIAANKKSVFIICPVQHETLHRFDTYEA